MDPNAALAMALDVGATRTERKEAADSLRGWLARGGFHPTVERVFTAARCHASVDGGDRVLCGADVSPDMFALAAPRCARCATVLAAAGAARVRWI